jgi:uncharacterized protein
MAKNNKNKGSMSVSDAGQKGGEATRDKHGPEFYSEIGSQQGKENNPGNFANRPEDEVRRAGQAGGSRDTEE